MQTTDRSGRHAPCTMQQRQPQMTDLFRAMDLPPVERALADTAAQTGIGIQQSLEALLAEIESLTSRPADRDAYLMLMQSARTSFADVASQLAKMNDALRARIAQMEAGATQTR